MSKVQAQTYANGTDLVNDLRTQADTAVWLRVPKGLDVSAGLKEWNDTLATLVSSYEFTKVSQANTTAQNALKDALKKAETISVQTLFSNLSEFIPDEKEAETTDSSVFNKDKLLEKYGERFTLVFD